MDANDYDIIGAIRHLENVIFGCFITSWVLGLVLFIVFMFVIWTTVTTHA